MNNFHEKSLDRYLVQLHDSGMKYNIIAEEIAMKMKNDKMQSAFKLKNSIFP